MKLKARILVFNVGVKIVVTCFNNCQPYVHVRSHDQFRLASKVLRDLRVPPRSSWELRSSGSGKIATTRCVITLRYYSLAILPLPEEHSSYLLRGVTPQMAQIFAS